MIYLYHCRKCGYGWIPRTESPKQCPQCHTIFWGPRKRKMEEGHETSLQIQQATRQARARQHVRPSTPQERLESMERRLKQMEAEGYSEEALGFQRHCIAEQKAVIAQEIQEIKV